MEFVFFALFVAALVAALLLWSKGHTLAAERSQAIQRRAEVEAQLAAERERAARWELRAQQLARFERVEDAERAAEAMRLEAASWAKKQRDEAEQDATRLRAETRTKRAEAEAEASAIRARAAEEAARIVESANRRAEETAGEALLAVREAKRLEATAAAMRNVIEGYGDRYVAPSAGLLDDLAEEFGFAEAGARLKAARETARAMIASGTAATSDYAETNRRTTAIEFVLDAFNGKVDSILGDVRHDNAGTLEQKIRDAYVLVNHNGKAFRSSRILPAYLDTRLEELRWAVVALELRLKQREEQRLLKERIREEERAQREYEKAMKDAAKEQEMLQKAMEKARRDVEKTTGEERARFEAKLLELTDKLRAAEEKNQRALSMAQQTRSGNVYVISNVGSFGEDVFKVGMTRRLEPLDRVRELGDASVPFEFDVHALLPSDDAPTLERTLHQKLVLHQVNKVNPRKEFFRVPLLRIREEIEGLGLQASWTLAAEAKEYRETQAIERALLAKTMDESTWVARQRAAQPDENLVAIAAEED